MTVQAYTLLDHLGGRSRRRTGSASVLAVASGSGGVGVSLIAASLALRSAAAGHRTLLVDADPWLEVQGLWLGVRGGGPLERLSEGIEPEALVVPVDSELELLSFGPGEGAGSRVRHLARRVTGVFARRDVVVIDAGSGLGALERADDLNVGSLLVVTGADPVGLAATHALLKAAWSSTHTTAAVVFNRVSPEQANAGRAVLAEGGRRYLGAEPEVLPPIPLDPGLGRALGDGSPLNASLTASVLAPYVDQVMRGLSPWVGSRYGR